MLYNAQATARSTDWASVLSLGVLDILVVPTNVVKFPKPSPISNINSITLRSAILKLFKRRQPDGNARRLIFTAKLHGYVLATFVNIAYKHRDMASLQGHRPNWKPFT
jgi:hypothetical protein